MKRVFINIILAFSIAPISIILYNYYLFEIAGTGKQVVYSGTFLQYMAIISINIFLTLPLLLLMFVLLPYNLIMIRNKSLSYTQQVIICMAIMIADICIFGSFSNIWRTPYWKNVYYLLYIAFYSICTVGIHRLFLDRNKSASADKI